MRHWLEYRFDEMKEKAGVVEYLSIPEYSEFEPQPTAEELLSEHDAYYASISHRMQALVQAPVLDYDELDYDMDEDECQDEAAPDFINQHFSVGPAIEMQEIANATLTSLMEIGSITLEIAFKNYGLWLDAGKSKRISRKEKLEYLELDELLK